MTPLLMLALLVGQARALQPGSSPAASAPQARPQIILAFAEDPHRPLTAARLQRQRPGSEMYIQGDRSLLELSVRRLRAARLWSEPPPHLLELRGPCDTVGQLTAFVPVLDRFPAPGRLTVVTSRGHLGRALAIARTLTVLRGWQVDGAAVDAGFVAPQHPLSTPRDVMRALLWNVTGWHGRPGNCSQRPVEPSRFR